MSHLVDAGAWATLLEQSGYADVFIVLPRHPDPDSDEALKHAYRKLDEDRKLLNGGRFEACVAMARNAASLLVDHLPPVTHQGHERSVEERFAGVAKAVRDMMHGASHTEDPAFADHHWTRSEASAAVGILAALLVYATVQ